MLTVVMATRETIDDIIVSSLIWVTIPSVNSVLMFELFMVALGSTNWL